VVERSGAIAVSVLQECPLVSTVGELRRGRKRERDVGEGWEGRRGGREGGRERGRNGVGRIPCFINIPCSCTIMELSIYYLVATIGFALSREGSSVYNTHTM
jgi:hypothetical protein